MIQLGELQATAVPVSPCVTVHPKEIDDPLVNPSCGWGIWAGPRFFDSRKFSIEYNTVGFGDKADLFSWVLVDWMWADLEPEEGKFQWDDLDTIVQFWGSRGKQIVVRLWVTSDPGWAGAGNKACPDWLWKAGVKHQEYRARAKPSSAAGLLRPLLRPHLFAQARSFLTAYRDRYHKPGSPILMDHIMGYGDWGEWHVMWSHYKFPSREAKRAVLIKVINTYTDIFTPNQLGKRPLRELAMAHVYDDDCGGDTPLKEAMWRQALDVGVGYGVALTRNGYVDGLSGWPQDLMAKYWKTNPLIAEGNWSYDQVKDDKTHGTMKVHVDRFIQIHNMYAHIYMHANNYKRALAEDRKELERGAETRWNRLPARAGHSQLAEASRVRRERAAPPGMGQSQLRLVFAAVGPEDLADGRPG